MKELSAVLDENERLQAELARARELLRRHGIDPDEPDLGGSFGDIVND
jgi:hypothetical protein